MTDATKLAESLRAMRRLVRSAELAVLAANGKAVP